MQNERIVAAERISCDEEGLSLRPKKLSNFIGQSKLKSNLEVFIQSALSRDTRLDHTLLYGPPGLGKTTLASIIATEMHTNMHTSTGPLLTKAGDLAAILTNLSEDSILFIDEIHRVNRGVEEMLYSAMEDFHLDIVVGEGVGARSIRIDTPKFTLVGATTRTGLLSNPLRDRFGILLNLDFYDIDDLAQIIMNVSAQYDTSIEPDAARKLASAARGTPRIVIRLFKRIIDFAIISKVSIIGVSLVEYALKEIAVDLMGLDVSDMKYLNFLKRHKDIPIGIDTIAAALSEHPNNIEEVIEPYLIQIGFLIKSSRGRLLTSEALTYLQ